MKTVILYSGGMDSYIMGLLAGAGNVVKLHYDIGQPYAEWERAALPADVVVRRVEWLTGGALANNSSGSGAIMIPGRNLALATLAACQECADEVWIGALRGEVHERATDKNFTFAALASCAIGYALKPYLPQVRVRLPLAERGWNKLDAARWALANGGSMAALKATRSCLAETQQPCGGCVVCLRRWGLFRQLGTEERTLEFPPLSTLGRAVISEMLSGDKYDEARRAEVLPAWLDFVGTDNPVVALQAVKEQVTPSENSRA
jgi:7-cyano-7-deazaguanine synthase in queuosine biosynthesis